jgi:zinc transport system ATP-binding protein
VAVTGLGVRLGGLPVLRQVDLRVESGQLVALLGANGSGKTTLVRALLGLTPYQSGSIELFGQPQADFKGWAAIGYVPQRATISLHSTTLIEVVRSGVLARRRRRGGRTATRPLDPAAATAVGSGTGPARGRNRAGASDPAVAALAEVGLADQAKELFLHLSGGQQQRALLARALAQDPDLLVLDEPLAGVDLTHQRAIAAQLDRFRDQGRSVLVVLHETDALAHLIDRAVVLREGRVTHDGPLPELPPSHRHEHEAPLQPAGLVTGMEPRWIS